MEDAHVLAASLPSLPGCSFFAIHDGHGGTFSATFAAEQLLPSIVSQPDLPASLDDGPRLADILKRSFIQVDTHLRKEVEGSEHALRSSGCTACIALVTPTLIVCGNAGDSRCIVVQVRGSCRGKSTPLTAGVASPPCMPHRCRAGCHHAAVERRAQAHGRGRSGAHHKRRQHDQPQGPHQRQPQRVRSGATGDKVPLFSAAVSLSHTLRRWRVAGPARWVTMTSRTPPDCHWPWVNPNPNPSSDTLPHSCGQLQHLLYIHAARPADAAGTGGLAGA